MLTNNAAVAIYRSHAEAEAAIKELQPAGFDLKQLSIITRARPTEEHVVGYDNVGNGMKYWGKNGGCWGGISRGSTKNPLSPNVNARRS